MSKSKNIHWVTQTDHVWEKRKRAPWAREHPRRKANISFQACGNSTVKFCKPLALTPALTKVLGREIWKIVPDIVKKDPASFPLLSVWHDKENGNLIIRCDARKTKDEIIYPKDGVASYKVQLRKDRTKEKDARQE